jgi:hypothetical protein
MDGAADGHVARLLELDAGRSGAAVLSLRREFGGQTERWTLGSLGTFEIDAAFVGVTLQASTFAPQRITTSGRLWVDGVLAVAPVEVALLSTARPPTELSITPVGLLPPPLAADPGTYRGLALAALEELAEALLYHAATATTI